MMSAREQFQTKMGYDDEDMFWLDRKVAIAECWGAPMNYERLLELLDEHGRDHIIYLQIMANKTYYGDWQWTAPHPQYYVDHGIDPMDDPHPSFYKQKRDNAPWYLRWWYEGKRRQAMRRWGFTEPSIFRWWWQ